MTARELYEYALIELNKIEAPSLLLEDYNYFINKAVQQYINLVNAKREIDQQSTDDIRVLKASAILKPKPIKINESFELATGNLFQSTYDVTLPADYLHLLNCIVEYTVNISNFKCYDKGQKVYFAARHLTPELYSQILNNAYLRPSYKRPYYYLNNMNTNPGNYSAEKGLDPVTNSEMDNELMDYNKGEGTTPTGKNYNSNTKGPKETEGGGFYAASNLVDTYNSAGDRLANPSNVRLELRFGRDDGVFTPTHLYIDYLKAPMYIRLTQDQLDSTLDYSQLLEFPDYVCFEIVNIFTRLIMENASDPRLQTNIPINNTIAAPAQMQPQQQAK